MLHSSITSYHFQQILVCQSAIICHEILSTASFSTSQTSKMHCTTDRGNYQQHLSQHRRQAKCTTTDRGIISQPRCLIVGRYQKQNTFGKSTKRNCNNSFYIYS